MGGSKGMPDLVKQVNRILHNDDPRWSVIPDGGSYVGGLMFAFMASSPIPGALKEFVDTDDQTANLVFFYYPDLDAAERFYTGLLGLREVRRSPIGDEATLVWLADEEGHYHVELTYNHGRDDYELGDQFGHLAFDATDLAARGETIRVDTGCLVAFQESVDYDIQFIGGFKNTLFGGEGLFLATLRGQGRVWLQSLPFSRLADRILQFAPRVGGDSRGEE